jgi:riboflavin-specific deaminase-like protein
MSMDPTMPGGARPRVTLHFAQSLDGRIAIGGTRAFLSSRDGMALAHRARAEADAVLVGSETVKIDDPQLTVRACAGPQPRRVVLASTLDIRESARVLARTGPGLLVIGVEGRATPEARDRLASLGAETCLVPPGPDGLVSLAAAVAQLHARGIARLLVEGGARVLTAFLRARLADEVTIEIAPSWLGASALAAIGSLGGAAADRGPSLTDMRVDRLGTNIVVRGRVAY